MLLISRKMYLFSLFYTTAYPKLNGASIEKRIRLRLTRWAH